MVFYKINKQKSQQFFKGNIFNRLGNLFYILIISLLQLYASNANGQIQTEFFVDDVATIEYVTVNFCVDDRAHIAEVKVVPNKTTYANAANIEALRNYLLSVEYFSDSKLRNNCYESTFEFINETFRYKNLSSEECIAAEKLKKGIYSYKHVLYQNTKIKRRKRIQREVGKDDKQIYFIDWTSNCTYTLTYKRMTEDRLKKLIGNTIEVEIIELYEDGSYAYRAKASHKDKIDYGVIYKH